jgi:hypothetical protein
MLRKTDGSAEYHVVSIPKDGETIEATIADDQLSSQLHLPVGRQLTYQVNSPQDKNTAQHRLLVELTLLGQFRLVSDTGASAAFQEVNGVIAFYDRKGPKDRLLDMWVLANGLTPLTEIAHHWRDAPSATLVPLSINQRLLLNVLHPMGCGLDSEYQRHWDHDQSVWIQRGVHTLLLAGSKYIAETVTVIDPTQGCKSIELTFSNKRWCAELTEQGLIEDIGVPRWSKPVEHTTDHRSSKR